MARIEEKKLEMMSQKARMHFQKKKAKEAKTARPLLLVSPFLADSIHSRLNLLEILTLMSDYRSAYHMIHTLFVDIKNADTSKMLQLEKKDTVRVISICLYVQDKLRMSQGMIDLYESFICNDDIMDQCNPFSLYYMVENAKHNPKLQCIHRYQSDQMRTLRDKFVKMRL